MRGRDQLFLILILFSAFILITVEYIDENEPLPFCFVTKFSRSLDEYEVPNDFLDMLRVGFVMLLMERWNAARKKDYVS